MELGTEKADFVLTFEAFGDRSRRKRYEIHRKTAKMFLKPTAGEFLVDWTHLVLYEIE